MKPGAVNETPRFPPLRCGVCDFNVIAKVGDNWGWCPRCGAIVNRPGDTPDDWISPTPNMTALPQLRAVDSDGLAATDLRRLRKLLSGLPPPKG